MKRGAGTLYRYAVPHGTGAYRQNKSTGLVADTVANVIAALLTCQSMTQNAAIRAVARAGEGKGRSFNTITANGVMTQIAVILLNDLSFPSPNDVIRAPPLRPSSL